ncbi:MAG: hypothetical protein MUE30_08955 [Spirosomaceae bacterium]|jgi:hypothetical protein|nr:hypothetical protein [Spirosomataceae bacterium]
MSKFTDWNLQRLNKRFGLKRLPTSELLEEWLTTHAELTDIDVLILEELRQKLVISIDYYNEQELVMKVISPILNRVMFDGETFTGFSERPISAVIDGETLYGLPDLLIAHGTQEPETPYFCLHEYKRGIESSGDPVGQCLAAMLVAQALNDLHLPIYGCSVVGKDWRFIVLTGNEYAVSNSYITTQQDEILAIVRILKVLKAKIEKIEAGL